MLNSYHKTKSIDLDMLDATGNLLIDETAEQLRKYNNGKLGAAESEEFVKCLLEYRDENGNNFLHSISATLLEDHKYYALLPLIKEKIGVKLINQSNKKGETALRSLLLQYDTANLDENENNTYDSKYQQAICLLIEQGADIAKATNCTASKAAMHSILTNTKLETHLMVSVLLKNFKNFESYKNHKAFQQAMLPLKNIESFNKATPQEQQRRINLIAFQQAMNGYAFQDFQELKQDIALLYNLGPKRLPEGKKFKAEKYIAQLPYGDNKSKNILDYIATKLSRTAHGDFFESTYWSEVIALFLNNDIYPTKYRTGGANESILEYLLAYNNVEFACAIMENRKLFNISDIEMKHAFLKAALEGCFEAVKWCVEKEDINVNFQNYKGGTALMNAAHKGSPEIVQYLIDKGANLHATTKNGSTAYSIAQHRENELCVRLITNAINKERCAKAYSFFAAIFNSLQNISQTTIGIFFFISIFYIVQKDAIKSVEREIEPIKTIT